MRSAKGASYLRLLRPHPDFDLAQPIWQMWTYDRAGTPPYAALSWSWSAGDTSLREVTVEYLCDVAPIPLL